MDPLESFYNDDVTKNALLQHLYSEIDQEALTRLYEGKDVSHIRDAKALIDRAFTKLADIYSKPKNHGRTKRSSK